MPIADAATAASPRWTWTPSAQARLLTNGVYALEMPDFYRAPVPSPSSIPRAAAFALVEEHKGKAKSLAIFPAEPTLRRGSARGAAITGTSSSPLHGPLGSPTT